MYIYTYNYFYLQIQVAFHICRSPIHRFSQVRIKNIRKKFFRKFQNTKVEFATYGERRTEHLCCVYNY